MDQYFYIRLFNWFKRDIVMSGLFVDSVIKNFGIKQIVTDVFVSCKEGEIIGLLGRNGAGKSTLLKIIFGSLVADRKYVRVDNKLIKGLYDNRNMVNYLPQDNFLPDHIKIKRLIGLFCDKTEAELLFKNEFISPLLEKKCRQLSGGEKRLLEVLMIVNSWAKYILIDEPFNGIAPVYKDYIKNIIVKQSKFKGFIITDHDYRNILDVSTRIVLIYDGGTKEIKHKDELKYWGYLPY